MRDFLVLAIILLSAPIALFSPYFGILMWYWIAYFSPHRYTWELTNFPVAAWIGVPTLIGLVFTRDLNRRFLVRETVLALLFWGWTAVTLFYAAHVPLFAGHLDDGHDQLVRVSKILLMTFVAVLVVTSPSKLKMLVVVTALSFGVRAVAGAFFAFQTGGQYRIYGPEGTFIEDNNDFALALNMVLPLLFYLAREQTRPLYKKALYACFACAVVCVILTYSRGGLLGLTAVLVALSLKSRRKLIGIGLLGATAVAVLAFAPAAWTGRMNDLAEGQVDSSGQMRLLAWGCALNLVKDYPITGGGFEVFPDLNVVQRYAAGKLNGDYVSSGPHSIYFQTLGEQGIVGFALFVALLVSCFLSLRKLRKAAARIASLEWTLPYCHMTEISLLAFVTSGTFLGRAYFDLWFMVLAWVIILKVLVGRQLIADRMLGEVASRKEELEEVAVS
jgi:putative inorganic carbon (hco3(-)) transporter